MELTIIHTVDNLLPLTQRIGNHKEIETICNQYISTLLSRISYRPTKTLPLAVPGGNTVSLGRSDTLKVYSSFMSDDRRNL